MEEIETSLREKLAGIRKTLGSGPINHLHRLDSL
jgi:hypothetical protein